MLTISLQQLRVMMVDVLFFNDFRHPRAKQSHTASSHFSNKRVLLSVLDFHCELIQLWMFLLCCNRVLTRP